MDLATFAVDDGYAEAVVRGLRSSFLTPDIYEALKATQSIADFKTVSLHFFENKIQSLNELNSLSERMIEYQEKDR
jgi:hypothetical protein